MARSIPLSFPWVPNKASKAVVKALERRRSTDAEASTPLVGMLLAALPFAALAAGTYWLLLSGTAVGGGAGRFFSGG